ncbi:MAG: TRAP transporter small permease [Sulfuritalea sp.]|jgi:TRAP-type C4-dicarboxylate transport system permease small subunit|nr:TRAP transporter small permease [Sulfuritalea sp.]MDP1982836.1 TRAP transporter small permease [Sulfuritalea sp.]
MADALFVDTAARPDALAGRVLNALCRFFAVCAGIVLILMALMSLTSIVGRALFDKPILGDYELVQMMSAVAVTMSLPFCQMIRGHIIVDFFTTALPARVNKKLDIFASLLLAVAAFVFCWRITLGMIDLYGNGDSTMLLNLSTWWGYAPMVPSFFLLGCAALYTAWVDFTGTRA